MKVGTVEQRFFEQLAYPEHAYPEWFLHGLRGFKATYITRSISHGMGSRPPKECENGDGWENLTSRNAKKLSWGVSSRITQFQIRNNRNLDIRKSCLSYLCCTPQIITIEECYKMGRNKKYSGYKAYQYLKPGVDYKVFKLREAIKEDWAYTVPLMKSEEDRVEEIIEKNIVIDLHDHPVLMAEDPSEETSMNREGKEFMAYEAMSRSGIDAVFDNLMNGSAIITSKHGWKWSDTIHDLGQRLCDIAHQDFVIHCKKVNDIITAHTTGQLAWVAVLESASCIENEVDRIDVLYGLGIRSIGLAYSESNMLGSGLKEQRDGGLTDFGYDAIV
ncbi:MAG: membrane dipeptidase, partial [Candidatus Heimdallarchaeota archaeon]